MQNLVGQTLGNYQITAFLGQGGMSNVYRARQTAIGREVAIKVLKERYPPDSPLRERFTREVQIVATLEHLHILPIYDYGVVDDYPYLVMRLLDGGSLNARIQKQPLSAPEVERLTLQIAAALDYAHAKGVIHRDMKPHNVLLDGQGNAYLCDFGIAKVTGGDHALTRTGEAVGTPNYMSPEQWQGLTVSPQSDVYALGIMVYEMLAGRPPFEAENVFSLMYKHLNELPPLLGASRLDVPPAVDAVIGRALAKLPAERFASAGDLARALSAALRSASAPPPSIEHSSSPPRKTAELAQATAPLPRQAADEAGQAWVMEAFRAWREDPNQIIFYLVGPHGIGKSALIRRCGEKIGRRVLRYDLSTGSARALDPRAFVESLAWQLTEFVTNPREVPTGDALREILADPFEALESRVLGPLAEVARSGEIVILLNSLEAAFEHPAPNIIDLLRYMLANWPDGVRLVAASVPDDRLRPLFRAATQIDLRPDTQDRASLAATLSTRFATLLPHLSGGEVDLQALIDKAEGRPLYLNLVIEALAAHRLTLSDLPTLPAGLEALFSVLITRYAEAVPEARQLLYLLVASRAPLPTELITRITGIPAHALPTLRPLITQRTEGWQPGHVALRYWLASTDPAALRAAHQALAIAHQGLPPESLSGYALSHWPGHALHGNGPQAAYALLTDLRFLAARLGRVALTEIMDDYAQVRAALAPLGRPEAESVLEMIMEAVKATVPSIAGDTESLFPLLYNRLAGVPELETALQQAAKAYPRTWLRIVWPTPPAPISPAVPIWRGPMAVSVAAGRAAGDPLSRLTAEAPSAVRTVWIAAGADGFVRLWHDGTLIREWVGAAAGSENAALRGAAISADGTRGLIAAADGRATLWDLVRDTLLHILHTGDRPVAACALTPDGEYALTAGEDRLLRLYRTADGGLIEGFQLHPAPLTACAFAGSADRRVAVSGAVDGSVRAFNAADGSLLHVMEGHRGAVTCLAGLENRPLAASGGADGAVLVWDVRAGMVSRNLAGATGAIASVALAEINGVIWAAAASEDGYARLWDVESGQLVARHALNSPASACALTPDGRVLAGGRDGRLWAFTVRRESHSPVEPHGGEVRGIAFTPDSGRVLSGAADRELRLWHADNGALARVMRGHTGAVNALALRADGKVALSAGADKTARLWDTERGALIRMVAPHTDSVTACALSPRPLKVGAAPRPVWAAATGSADRAVKVWEVESGTVLQTLKGHRAAVKLLAFSPVDEFLLSLSTDGAGHLWSLLTGKTTLTFEDPITGYTAAAFSPDGARIVFGRADGSLTVYDRAAGSRRTLAGATGTPVTAVALSPDGGVIAAADSERLIRLIESREGVLITRHRAAAGVGAVAFAPNGVLLAVGDGRGGVAVLRVENAAGNRQKRNLL
jgi:WD40 repeat protein/tRNA A-37 threonylcarbamoyl transferase component Bud32